MYLMHHGVKGMKWGVWNEETRNRYQSHIAPQGIMKKGTTLARVSTQSQKHGYKHDPLSGDVKYVSTNNDDHWRWIEYFRNSGHTDLAGVMYETTRDIKVASATQAGKTYVDNVLHSSDKKLSKKSQKEAEIFWNSLNKTSIGADKNETFSNFLSRSDVDEITKNSARQVVSSMALQNYDTSRVSGKALVSELSKQKYEAVQDALGWNVAADPLIVFNPKKNLNVMYDQRSGYRK